MKPKLTGFEKTWIFKALGYFFLTSGFGRGKLPTLILKLHRMMVPINLIYVCQISYTVILDLKKENSDLGKMAFNCNNGALILHTMVCLHVLTKLRTRAFGYIENSARLLHCSSKIVEQIIWRKYMPTLKFLFLFFVLPVYLAPLSYVILTPLFRFMMQSEAPSYIVYPMWYPVDVLSSRGLFWSTYLYEAMICFNCSKIFGDMNIMMVYCILWNRVRFEVLGEFFKTIISARKCIVSGKKQIKSEETQLLRKDDRSYSDSTISTSVSIQIIDRVSKSTAMIGAGATWHSDVKMYKRGFEDWIVLSRHFKIIKSSIVCFTNALYAMAIANNVSMTFAAFHMLQKTDIPILDRVADGWLFMYISLSGLSQMLIFCYLGNLFVDTNEMLRPSVWRNNWSMKTKEVKKLLCMFQQRLGAPLTMRAFRFVKINLKTFRKSLSLSYSFFSFLIKIATPLGSSGQSS